MPSTRRRRLPDFFVSMWLPVAFRCRTLPVLVTRNRFAAPRCDFIFGTADPSSLPLGLPLPTTLALGRGLRSDRRYLLPRRLGRFRLGRLRGGGIRVENRFVLLGLDG